MEATKFYGIIGDRNPIEHDGGVVFEGDYGPMLLYFQGWEGQESPRVTVSSVPIAENALEDLNWVNWESVASCHGMDVEELKGYAVSENILARAQVYECVAGYHGWGELDPIPTELSLEETEKEYGEFVDQAHAAS